MTSLRVSILQMDIVWENKQDNLCRLRERLKTLHGATEIAVLPETFSTGFTMQPEGVAESITDDTITTLSRWAKEFDIALTGSYIARDTDCPPGEPPHYYNRAFFLSPDGENHFRDKHHLFRMGEENTHFTAGTDRSIISYREWNIRLLICYDLRFPVWSRNIRNECDLLIYVANWPASRRKVWDVLLQARALENICYVCGVNRIGTDNNGLSYNGGSVVYSPKGELLIQTADNCEEVATALLDLPALKTFREKFPAWQDADPFKITDHETNKN